MATTPDVLVIIPALNEQDTVASVVGSVREFLGCDVLVVDDGSNDDTAALALASGAFVVSHPFNLGVGAALRTGFRYAVECGYRAAVQIDADGQHVPASAAALLAPVLDGSGDLVVGSRFADGYEVGFVRGRGMRILSRMVSRRIGVRLTDTTSGFRAFSHRTLGIFAESYPSMYLSDTVEALLLAHAEGLRIIELPARMQGRQGGTASAGSFASAFHFLRLMLVIMMSPVRRPLSARGAR